MFVRWTAWLPRIRRWFSRSEWALRWLGIPRTSVDPNAPGLVLIQIDGLSRTQLERAMAAGNMPLLKRLAERERYEIHTLYSGIPSSTPSVQGELFYGARCAVPAFSFRSADLGREVAMFEPDAAENIEERIAAGEAGLLSGGSAYCDIYSGGAEETHFCAQNLGWGGFVRSVHPARVMFFITWYIWRLVRAAGLTVLEFGLATADFVRGSLTRGEFFDELRFIPARVGVVVLLRELVTIGTTLDIARGLPVIHLNLLGYDEQAHRRGPESAFAHWTLKGIDRAIRTIWLAAHRSVVRQYDVWIYSDHGQETTTPYPHAFGRTIQQSVAEIAGRFTAGHSPPSPESSGTFAPDRARWLGEGRLTKALFQQGLTADRRSGPSPTVVANGPVGLVYLSERLKDGAKRQFATALVEEAGCPLVVYASDADSAVAVSQAGQFVLPADAALVLGDGHPFRDEVAEDLVRLANHRDAGDVLVCGWRKTGGSLSFPVQHGAHAGPGPEETRAFLVAPSDAPLPRVDRNYFRPDDVRQAASRLLNGQRKAPVSIRQTADDQLPALRVVTYNVHGCVGMDNRLSPERIARVIARSNADVVALQELDVSRPRSGGVDQAHQIARLLEMEFHFHPAWALEEEQFGDAILSRYPIQVVKAGALRNPAVGTHEMRGALWVQIEVKGSPIQLINTHLAVDPAGRRPQLQDLLGDQWLRAAIDRGPAILCGDFNFGPVSRQYRRLCEHLVDAQVACDHRRTAPTWFSWRPIARIDHVLVTTNLQVVDSHVQADRLARNASDHLPLVVEIVPVAVRRESPSETLIPFPQPILGLPMR